jgi:hypothetical protein
MRMKNRWIAGLLVAIALSVAACAPPNQGGGASAEPSDAAAPQATPGTSAEPMDSATPKASGEPGRGGYDY